MSEDIKKKRYEIDPQIVSKRLSQLMEAPQSGGKRYLKLHYEGKKISASQAIVAFCCECLGHYVDGRADCETYHCPLYPWMPYGLNRKRYIAPNRRKDNQCS